MTYFKPYIDDSGLHVPTYNDVKEHLIEGAKNIFGDDIYLGEDSMDYQLISTYAEKAYDCMCLAQLTYNNRSPATAVKSGLDGIVKINAIKRKSETYSTCKVTVGGNPNGTIKKGVGLSSDNIKWSLPPEVKLNEIGEAITTVTCSIPGPISLAPGELIYIFNPQYGWNYIYNNEHAELGSYSETDSQLRLRQSQSTAQSTRTVLEGTAGEISQLNGVTRSKVYENDTNLVDSLGLPPHSITCVVEGGEDKEIAECINKHKGPGCYTNGDIETVVIDSQLQENTIRHFRPTYIDIDVTLTIKKLSGYNTAIEDSVKSNVEDYLNSMQIGNKLCNSSLWAAALQATMNDLNTPLYSIRSVTSAIHGESQNTNDINMLFNQVCRGNSSYITIIYED